MCSRPSLAYARCGRSGGSRTGFFLIVSLALLCSTSALARAELVVHEWGTITSWHKADGTPEGGLNRIEASEVLPPFVHTFEPPVTRSDPAKALVKTVLGPGRPDVTMRLETPVMYFYPPPDRHDMAPFGVDVSFRGGVINEFFPDASANVTLDIERVGQKMGAGILADWTGDVLNNYVLGSVSWTISGLHVMGKLLRTDDPVWLAPRKVASSHVVASGEAEKYLFYRGVAHLDALLQTRVSSAVLTLLSPDPQHWMRWLPAATARIPRTWVVAINERGEAAYRLVENIEIRRDAPAETLDSFSPFRFNEFRAENLSSLQRSMREALVAEGLFQDEAEAMLATWRHSYFEKPGRRIFYVVPQEWLEYHLPVTISIPHRVSRAFIGRIDLIEPRSAD